MEPLVVNILSGFGVRGDDGDRGGYRESGGMRPNPESAASPLDAGGGCPHMVLYGLPKCLQPRDRFLRLRCVAFRLRVRTNGLLFGA